MSDSELTFLDLSLVITYAGGATFALLIGVGGIVRILLAIPLVIFLPGYALISMLYPDRGGPDKAFDDEQTGLNNPIPPDQGLGGIERFVFSFVLSLIIVPAIALLATVTPWGVALPPILLGLGLSTLVLSLLAIFSRWRCPAERRFRLSGSLGGLLFQADRGYGRNRHVTVFNLALVISVLLLAGGVGYAIANPPEAEGFTEFYVETEEVTGETETMYESTYTAGESQPLTVYIVNQEHRELEYTTIVVLQRVSYDGDEATVEEEVELTRADATVGDGETHEQTLEVTPTMSGEELRLLVLLYVDEPPDDPSADTAYRVLRLPIEVS